MKFELTILGSSSALPTTERNPSAHLLNVNERLFLLDCAEGTQLQLRKFKIKFQRINHIFISHLHGDHYFGLMGLLFTYHLLGRKNALHLFAPEKLLSIIELQLEASFSKLIYKLEFHPLTEGDCKVIYQDKQLRITTFPLDHSVPTWGFVFREIPHKRKLRKNMLKKINLPIQEFEKIKDGHDFKDENGITHKNEELTFAPPPPRSFAYCTDTAYDERIIPYVDGVDILYHDATFMQDMAAIAAEKLHATAFEAASIAKKARVKKLILGHFSARYDDLNLLLEEARNVFPESYLGEDGLVFDVPFSENNLKPDQ